MIVPVPIAKTLLKFASSDKKRPNIYGVGVTEKGLSATDGFCSIVVTLSGAHSLTAGGVIDRKWLETQAKLAAVVKQDVDLGPPTVYVDGVIYPNVELLSSVPIESVVSVNAQYMQLISMAAEACEADRVSVFCSKPFRVEISGPVTRAVVMISPL